MDVPDFFSAQRRWCWAERTAFAMLLAVAVSAGFGLSWWGLGLYVVTLASGFGVDITRHREQYPRP